MQKVIEKVKKNLRTCQLVNKGDKVACTATKELDGDEILALDFEVTPRGQSKPVEVWHIIANTRTNMILQAVIDWV